MPYGKLIRKLKDYARNKKLETEASKGKQAVDVGRAAGTEATSVTKQEETVQGESVEEISAVSNVKCCWCQKKGHYASQCTKKQEYLQAKGKGKGGKGKGSKGKGKDKGKGWSRKGGESWNGAQSIGYQGKGNGDDYLASLYNLSELAQISIAASQTSTEAASRTLPDVAESVRDKN